MPIDLLMDAYTQHLGHEFNIEQFLVVSPDSGMHGVASSLSRIPHVITVEKAADGSLVLKATQPAGTNREQFVQADLTYREQIKRLNLQRMAQRSGAVG